MSAHGPVEQNFGGPWTILKLDTVEAFLRAFVQVMKKNNFRTVYIDGFAGSGASTVPQPAQLSLLDQATRIDGSARRALDLAPGFDELIFIDAKARNIRSLQEMSAGRQNVKILRGD